MLIHYRNARVRLEMMWFEDLQKRCLAWVGVRDFRAEESNGTPAIPRPNLPLKPGTDTWNRHHPTASPRPKCQRLSQPPTLLDEKLVLNRASSLAGWTFTSTASPGDEKQEQRRPVAGAIVER